MITYQLLLAADIILTVIGQLMLKKGMNHYTKFSINELPSLIKNKTVLLGIAAYGASLLIWLVVLSKLELSYAYPLISSNYILITLFSKLLFKEHVSKRRWISVLTIMLGVVLVSLS